MGTIPVHYIFRSGDAEQQYPLELDEKELSIVAPEVRDGPDWARLAWHQCPNCPLDPETTEWCPVALRLADLQPLFEHLISWQELDVEVVTEQRRVITRTTAQRAISAMMGLLMPVSDCPHTRFFRPMARFHLPFSSEEETIYRSVSMYLLGQYFVRQADGDADEGLEGLNRLYAQLQEINQHIAARLRDGVTGDSMINALVVLDIMARALPWAIEDSVEELRHLFEPYLEE